MGAIDRVVYYLKTGKKKDGPMFIGGVKSGSNNDSNKNGDGGSGSGSGGSGSGSGGSGGSGSGGSGAAGATSNAVIEDVTANAIATQKLEPIDNPANKNKKFWDIKTDETYMTGDMPNFHIYISHQKYDPKIEAPKTENATKEEDTTNT